MLHDRLQWHYDPHVPWNDEDAARAYIPFAQPAKLTAALAVAQPVDYQYDLTDHSQWQEPDPQWHPPPGLRGMVVRVCDGAYKEPVFASHFRLMDQALQAGELDYCMWYVLPSPNVSVQGHLDIIAAQLRDSGVTWGAPGHGFSIDDEPTPYHAQYTGQGMRDLRNALQQTYQREELHYVGLYNGNYGFVSDEGWKLWAPWPTSNGALPSWTTNLVMQQWGVAGPGEVPGFPNANVDVNHVFDWAALDALTGRDKAKDPWEALMADPAAMDMLRTIYGSVATPDPATGAMPTLADLTIRVRDAQENAKAAADGVGSIRSAGGEVAGFISAATAEIEKKLNGLSVGGVDVHELASEIVADVFAHFQGDGK